MFSSLLDEGFRDRLAQAMWRWVRPGGAVIVYDFTFDNPSNPEVRKIPLTTVRRLFPEGRISAQRITLAPPLARIVCRLDPRLYHAFNAIPLLRTHLFAWIAK